jgi:hypothetical protein
VDFLESCSPVANDITIRLLLVAMILFGLSAKIVDVETAFYTVNWKKRCTWKIQKDWKTAMMTKLCCF